MILHLSDQPQIPKWPFDDFELPGKHHIPNKKYGLNLLHAAASPNSADFSSHIKQCSSVLQGCNFDDYLRIKMGLNFFKPSATANGAVLSKKNRDWILLHI